MNPRPIPEDWTQISEGDTILTPDCNHGGLIELYDDMGTCGNCLARWASPARAEEWHEISLPVWFA